MSARKRNATKTHVVAMLSPATCGIYKKGTTRFRVDIATGKRTDTIDNELGDHVDAYLAGERPDGFALVPLTEIESKRILVPRYFDDRWVREFRLMIAREKLHYVSLGDLADTRILTMRGGHGSPSNDKRTGNIPYIKVSDVRSLRVNVNPTNLVTRAVAETVWGGPYSKLEPWDILTPNRASSNIGEFALLLPGEEERVLTKEFFIFRVVGGAADGWDWGYLLWALCLKSVRRQWQRVTLMQTNREDVGDRWREILLPAPKSAKWAHDVSAPFRDYFSAIATVRTSFVGRVEAASFDFIASVTAALPDEATGHEDE